MNLAHSLRVGIAVCIMLISICSSSLGDVSEYSGQNQIDSPIASLSSSPSEIPSESLSDALPEALPYHMLMEDIRELYSSEILLVNQSRQMDLNDTVFFADRQSIEPHISSLSAYESLLRERAIRLAQFELRLKEIWPRLSLKERVDITENLEGLLRHQAILIYDFQYQLKKKFCFFSIREKKKFLDSFEDLLHRDAALLLGFEDFLHHLQNAPEEDKIEFLASFEDLIRRQAILLEIYEDLLKTKCNILIINKYVSRCDCYRSGQTITYTYVIKNACNCTIEGIKIVDSRLGVIVEGISLGPYETKYFRNSTVLKYPPDAVVCNTAQAWGIDPNGFTTISESNEVCIRMCAPPKTKNQESLKLGNQTALAVASDSATAENNILIKKNQNGCENKDSANQMAIRVGDQLAASYRSSKGANNIKIVSNQQ
jgi:hypothetical protein